MAKAKRSLKDVRKRFTPATLAVDLCLDGSLFQRHRELEEELAAAQAKPDNSRLNSGSEARRIAEEIQSLEAQMREHSETFTFQQIPHQQWRDLIDAHPGKDGLRFNIETFPAAAVQACCVDPEGMDDPAEFEAFWGPLSQAQQRTLGNAAWEVNEENVSVPFSLAASVALRTSEPNSATASL